MATDSTPVSPGSEPQLGDELPAYRAISAWAVASFVFSLISIISFLNLVFLIASILAITAGAIALRMIKTYPDLLTGARLANFGISVGLICGLSSSTIQGVQWWTIGSQSMNFARLYVEKLALLKDSTDDQALAEVFYFQYPAEGRAGKTPSDIFAEIGNAAENQEIFNDPRYVVVQEIKRRLNSSPDQTVKLGRILERGRFKGVPIVYISLEFEGSPSKGIPEKERGLLTLRGILGGGPNDWYVSEVRYPLKEDQP